MIIDNFDFYRKQMIFRNPGDFYVITLMLRIKDINENSPEISKIMAENGSNYISPYMRQVSTNCEYDYIDSHRNTRKFLNYFIYSLKEYDNYKNEIILLCNMLNLRAYFLNGVQNNNSTLSLISKQALNPKPDARCFIDNFILSVIACYDEYENRLVSLDLDDEISEYKEKVLEIIGDRFEYISPTPNGCHIAFRHTDDIQQKIENLIPDKRIHAMAYDVLYCNVNYK